MLSARGAGARRDPGSDRRAGDQRRLEHAEEQGRGVAERGRLDHEGKSALLRLLRGNSIGIAEVSVILVVLVVAAAACRSLGSCSWWSSRRRLDSKGTVSLLVHLMVSLVSSSRRPLIRRHSSKRQARISTTPC